MSQTPDPAQREAFVGLLGSELRLLGQVCAIVMLRMAGLFMLLPVLALYARELPGGSALMAGLAVGGYGLTQAALAIPLGWLSDRIGRRAVLAAGLAAFALGSFLAAVADDAPALVLARLLQGAGAISGVLTATLADGVREHRRTRAMAFLGISIALSFILSLALGPWLAGLWGVPSVFLAIGIAAVLALAVVLVLPDRPLHAAPGVAEVLAVLARPGLIPAVTSAAVLHLVLTALFVVLPFELQTMGVQAGSHWWVYLSVLALSLPGTALLIRRRERASAGAGLALGFLVVGAGLAGLAGAPLAMIWVLPLGALYFAGFNYLEALLPSRVSEIAPGEARGAAMGLYATCQFSGAFLGGALAGTLLAWGPAPALAAAAALALLWSALLALIAQRGTSAGETAPPSS